MKLLFHVDDGVYKLHDPGLPLTLFQYTLHYKPPSLEGISKIQTVIYYEAQGHRKEMRLVSDKSDSKPLLSARPRSVIGGPGFREQGLRRYVLVRDQSRGSY